MSQVKIVPGHFYVCTVYTHVLGREGGKAETEESNREGKYGGEYNMVPVTLTFPQLLCRLPRFTLRMQSDRKTNL